MTRYIWLVLGFNGNEHYPVMAFEREEDAQALAARIEGLVEQIMLVAVSDE